MWVFIVCLWSVLTGLFFLACVVGWAFEIPPFSSTPAPSKWWRRIRRLSPYVLLFVAIYCARFKIWRSCSPARYAMLPWMCVDPWLHMSDRDDVLRWFGNRNSFGDGYDEYLWCYPVNDNPGWFTPALLVKFDREGNVANLKVGEWD